MIDRLKNISPDELMIYSRLYGFTLTHSQCNEIVHYLQNITLDPFKADHREQLFQDLSHLTNQHTAIKAKKLFKQMIKYYEVDHLF